MKCIFRSKNLIVVSLFAAALLTFVSRMASADDANRSVPKKSEVSFSRDVLPILSNKCFVCHGPDAGEISDLRLDIADEATADRGGYHAIDQADPENSELLARIASEDDPMPPADADKPLTDEERELIRRWILSGGQYSKHWAFKPPQKESDVPENESVIDWYVSDKLRQRGLDFSPPADPATLARRVALVLTGLPPEPDQLREYLAAPTAEAYDKLVDQLLASPRFGEHQARYWLDAVRYGDTHGLHLDNRRGIYPYRDWVVNAFNDNLPIDDFITWQLAGDLLPNPTLGQQVATGYVRLNPSTGEGGAIPAEFQMKNNFDRVETTGTVFLGMSLTCARCHTHKYDPILQSEYYQLLAFFNSTAEPAMDGNSYTYGPVAKVPADQAAWQRWKLLESERDRLLEEAKEQIPDAASLVEYAEQRRGWRTSDWRISAPQPLGSEPSEWSKASGLPGALSGRSARGKLPGENEAVWVSFTVKVPTHQPMQVTFSGEAGSRVMVDDANVPAAEKTRDDRVAIAPIQLSKGEHTIRVIVHGGAETNELEIRLENPWDALAQAGSWESCAKTARLKMLADAAGPLGDLSTQTEAAELAGEITAAESNFTTSLIARELPQPRPTKLLRRGEYDQPAGEPLQPNVLQIMGGLPEDAPRDRLGLAMWLTSAEHPLTSRVLINRVWQRTFGAGLVRTPEDFGLQGQQPTHPELLDWLAVEFQQSGWDLKHMLRLMVRSQTFQQSSAWRDDLDDPENRLLARASLYRLDAEVLRDLGLWASGMLDPYMGGEGVKPYQPSGMWLAMAHPASNTKSYVRDEGRRLYRRSLYVYWKRTSPHPMMTLFDAPDRESSCVRRSRTSTSLQSLGLFNETQRVEVARKFAERLIVECESDAERLDRLFQILACRPPNDVERAVCEELLKTMRDRYSGAKDDAIALLRVGDAAWDTRLDPTEIAAWTQLTSTVMASDVALLLY